MRKVLILIDPYFINHSLELINLAHDLFKDEPLFLGGFFPSKEVNNVADYFDEILTTQIGSYINLDLIDLTKIILNYHNQKEFDVILAPSTYYGKLIAPRIAAKLDTGLIADVNAIKHTVNGIEIIRLAYDGKIMAAITAISKPLMMTVQANVFQGDYPKISNKSIVAHDLQLATKNQNIKHLEANLKTNANDIRDAKCLIAAGGGIVNSLDDVIKLTTFLKANLAISRKVVDLNLADRSLQVGLSGKTVNPHTYIAFGISGAYQHLIGLKNIETLIAVNTDLQVPICTNADVVINADAKLVVEKLISLIQQN